MNSNKYEIRIRATVNGVEKVPSKITWIQGNDECLATPCYKENDYLVVKLIPDCVGNACIEGYLHFDDTCTNCEPEHFKRCFCNTDADCPDCSQCDENYGICVDQCKEGEFCKDDACIECDENTPCPNNQICINGHCECPPNMFKDGNRCVECTSTTNLGKCFECINGVITPKCDKACIELTGECVDCIGSGDCLDRTDGKNCCSDNQCDCCNGFEWDNLLKQCVPSCNETTCDECERCTKDGCQPIQCPEGYKCYKGECVYWPCDSVSCDNGAECGPECGCVEFEGVKQCVPCYILECNGLCEQALGCKCNGTKCESSDKCNQAYCDNENPCVGEDCTCYNNECVDCSNFPCSPDDCSSYQNCGCNDEGKCDGKDCNGNLELTKEKSCESSTGCKLKATLEKDACKCDPIVFKVENTHTCTTNSTTYLKLKTSLFKKVNNADIPYASYKTSPYFADNELVSTYIRSVIEYEYLKDGKFYKFTGSVTSTPSPATGIMDNVIADLTFDVNHIKKSVIVGGQTYPTKITISVFADGTKIQNADCNNYETPALIGSYVLDYSTTAKETDTCTVVNSTYKVAQISSILDTISSKKPRFTWFRSNSSTFGDNKFTYDGTYAKNGWFRKAFGTLQGNLWVDEINNPQKYEVSNTGELLANYNYMVKADCGCGSRTDIEEKVTFCCPTDFNTTITPCDRKIIVAPFNICSVNDTLPSNYNLPTEPQVLYKLVAILDNGLEVVTNLTKAGITKIYDNAIVSAKIVQTYEGGLLDGDESCVKELTIPSVSLPNPSIAIDCNLDNQFKITVTQTSPLNISKVEIFGNDILLTPTIYNTTPGLTATYNKLLVGVPINSLKAKVTFTNGCTKTVDLIPCGTSLDVEEVPVNSKSKKNCSNQGDGVTVETTVEGFNTNLDVNYTITGGDLLTPVSNTTGIFTNLGAGDYIITATQGNLTSTGNITIENAIDPIVTLNPSSICPGETATLTIEAPQGSQFIVTSPVGNIPVPTIPTSGVYAITGLTAGGTYTVTSINDLVGACHPFMWESTLEIGGQVLNPQINGNSTVCNGNPIEFTITDGINGKTYNVNAINGIITDAGGNVTSQVISGQSYFYTPTSIGSNTIQIVSIDSDCDTLLTTPVNKSITVTSSPTISNIVNTCANGITTVSANITTTSGTISGVTIGGVVATNVGSTYSVSGLTQSSQVDIVATGSNGCISTQTITVSNCNCPQATLTITGPATPLCGDQLITLTASPQLNPNIATGAWTYQWYDAGPPNCNNCTPLAIGAQGSWGTQPVTLQVNASGSGSYFLKVTNNLNSECTYTSNTYSYTVDEVPATPIISYTPDPVLVGTSVTFSVSPAYTNYAWYLNGNPIPSGNNSTYTFTPDVAGNYSIMVMVNNGNTSCTASASITVDVSTDCNKLGAFIGTSIPNACVVSKTFTLSYNNVGTASWTIVSVNGNPLSTSGLMGQTGILTGGTPPLNVVVDFSSPNTAPGELIDDIGFMFTYNINGGESCSQPITYTGLNYTRYAPGSETLVLDITDTNAVWQYTSLADLVATKDFVFLTDITINTVSTSNVSHRVYSNPSSTTGNYEYMLYHDRPTVGCAGATDADKDDALVTAWFGNARIMTPDIATLAAQVQLDINAIPILNGTTVTVVGTDLEFSNMPCEVVKIAATVYWGNSTACASDLTQPIKDVSRSTVYLTVN